MKIIAVGFALLTLLCTTLPGFAQAPQATPPASPVPPPAREIQAGESRLQFYGFVRTDVIYDDSRPDAAQTPLFINSERPGAEDQANFTLHPRLSRLGINFTGPTLAGVGDARVAGKLELDFQNGGRESRAIPRFRHAYATLAWPGVTLLVGNTWDLISPLFPGVNADTLMWNAGNLGDRRPQIRMTVQPKADKLQWSLAAAAGLTGAVDQQDLDNDTIRDGEAAAVPNLQGRAGLSWAVGSRRAGVGAWTHFAQMKVGAPIAGHTDFDSHSFGADVEFPVGRRVTLRGEAWTGENLSDFRGGIGQAINRTTGDEISSHGGWAEAALDVTRVYTASVGYTLDTPRREDLPAGARSRNGALFITNRWTVKPVVVGVDYLHWTTKYVAAPQGTDNRFNAYVVYSF